MRNIDNLNIIAGILILLTAVSVCIIYNYQETTINTYLNTINQQNDVIYENKKDIKFLTKNTIGAYDEVNRMNIDINKLQLEIEDYKEIIILKDIQFENKKGSVRKPTYAEVVKFFKEDQTDRNKWTKDYDCTQFAHEVIRNAREQNIYGCVVTIDFTNEQAHDLIVFDTDDMGIVYFEPQNDKYVYMYLGMDYASYIGYPDEISLIVKKYDNCFERINS